MSACRTDAPVVAGFENLSNMTQFSNDKCVKGRNEKYFELLVLLCYIIFFYSHSVEKKKKTRGNIASRLAHSPG